MPIKVIAFNGSARKDGNTAILLNTVLKELETFGIVTEQIHVGAKQLQGCIGCMQCRKNKNGQCALKNDPFNDWLKKMSEADGILIGSPVYCADLSAQIKAFIDRAAMVGSGNDYMFKRKVAAAVVAVRRSGPMQTFASINSFFTIEQMIVVGSSYWNTGFGFEKGEVLKDAEGMITMRNLARNMGWLLQCLALAKGKVVEPNTRVETITNFIRSDLE